MRATLLVLVVLVLLGLFALPLLYFGSSGTSVVAVPVPGPATSGTPISTGTGEWLRVVVETVEGGRDLNRDVGPLVDRLAESSGLSNGPLECSRTWIRADWMLTEEVGFPTALPSITLAVIEVFELRDGLEDLTVRATHLATDRVTVIAERELVWDAAGARWE